MNAGALHDVLWSSTSTPFRVDVLVRMEALSRMRIAGLFPTLSDTECRADFTEAAAALRKCEALGMPPDQTTEHLTSTVWKPPSSETGGAVQAIADYVAQYEADLARAILLSPEVQRLTRRSLTRFRYTVNLYPGRPHGSGKNHGRYSTRELWGRLEWRASQDPDRFVSESNEAIRKSCRLRRDGANHRVARSTFEEDLLLLIFTGWLRPATRWRHGKWIRGFIVVPHDELCQRNGNSCILQLPPLLVELRRRAGILGPDSVTNGRQPDGQRGVHPGAHVTEHTSVHPSGSLPGISARIPAGFSTTTDQASNQTSERKTESGLKTAEVVTGSEVNQPVSETADAVCFGREKGTTTPFATPSASGRSHSSVFRVPGSENRETENRSASARLSSLSEEGKPSGRTSPKSEQATVGDVVAAAKATDENARFTRRDTTEILAVLEQYRPTPGEAAKATAQIVSGMDDFALRRAGDSVAVELGPMIERHRKLAEQQRQTEAAMERLRADMSAEAEAEGAALERRAAEEAKEVEEAFADLLGESRPETGQAEQQWAEAPSADEADSHDAMQRSAEAPPCDSLAVEQITPAELTEPLKTNPREFTNADENSGRPESEQADNGAFADVPPAQCAVDPKTTPEIAHGRSDPAGSSKESANPPAGRRAAVLLSGAGHRRAVALLTGRMPAQRVENRPAMKSGRASGKLSSTGKRNAGSTAEAEPAVCTAGE